MSFLPGSTHTPRSRRDAGQPATTQALPTADPAALQEWSTGTEQADDGGTHAFAVTDLDGEQTSFQVEPLPAPAEEEPFVPKSRYVMGRSTKVMACILMVAAGVFAGSAIQKQIDAGSRGARTNIANFQGNGGGGSQTPGQGRRNGGSGTAGAGATGAGNAGAGTAGAGTGATAAPTAGTH
jgi:hypothetical protein